MRLPFVSRKKYDEVVYKLECLLGHSTGGKLSYHTYSLRTMEINVDDYIQECCDEAVKEAFAERGVKKCPLCGNEPMAICYTSYPPLYGYSHCSIHGGYNKDWHEAKAKWNEQVDTRTKERGGEE